ncbi:hypothetical protein QOZ80_2BG0162440 [Eleusine coracana subsp. coracana]|nr:hypothetical protein QOZ80_2BG0162440 [Eleusine coracana subsp. coracana]
MRNRKRQRACHARTMSAASRREVVQKLLKGPKANGRQRKEDEILTQMVNKHGLNNWQTVARAIPNRNALQCRMRWKNSLDPAVNKEAWSEQEELRLIRAHQLYGNKWLKMVKHFPGRTNYALKEHWRGPMKRKLDSYLASGLVEQVPDLHDDMSAPESSQSDVPKDNVDLSERKQTPPALRLKSLKRLLPNQRSVQQLEKNWIFCQLLWNSRVSRAILTGYT